MVVYDIKKENGSHGFSLRQQKEKGVIIYIADAGIGLLTYTKEEFLKYWLSTKKEGEKEGTALLLEPTPEFYSQEDEQQGKLKFMCLFGFLRPYRKFMVQLSLGMLTGSIISMIFPFLIQSIVDFGGNNDLAFVVMVLVAQLLLTLGQVTNMMIISWIILHVITQLSISLISDFLIKLVKLPMAFFDAKRLVISCNGSTTTNGYSRS